MPSTIVTNPTAPTDVRGVRLLTLLLSVFVVVFGLKLFAIGRYGTDLPYSDQWAKEGELFYAPWFERHEFWKNLFVPHSEHRIAPTLALNLGLVRLCGDQWDARVQCVVNGALHAGLAAGLALWAFRRLSRRWALAATSVIVLVTAPPIAWENVLGGFQSQFYFLTIFSLLAIGGLANSAALTWPWLAGLLAAALAAVSMGSGVLVAVPTAVVVLLRLPRRRQTTGPSRRYASAILTLLALLVYGGICVYFRPKAPWHVPLHAHSIIEYLHYVAQCLAWPRQDSAWIAIVLWAPWLIFAIGWIRVHFTPTPPPGTPASDNAAADFIFAGGLWVLAQIAAVAYFRANAGAPPSRYGDVFALGLVFNAFALATLITAKPEWPEQRAAPEAMAAPRPAGSLRRGVRLLAFVWGITVVVSVALATRSVFATDLAQKKRDSAAFEQSVRTFVLTGDQAMLKTQPIPFPYFDWFVRILQNPSIRRLLPVSVRPPIPLSGLAAPLPPAPELAHRATRTVSAPQTWRSSPLSAGSGWWKIETAGDIGLPGASLSLVAVQSGQVLAQIAPTKPAGNSWRAAYVQAPAQPAILVARVESPATWIAFSGPVEMSGFSYRVWRLSQDGLWVAIAGAIGFVISSGLLLRSSRVE